MSDTPLPNFAELFPVDAGFWHEAAAVTIYEAVFVSLGIEPRLIENIPDEHDENNELISPIYGVQHNEYCQRLDLLRRAIAAEHIAYKDNFFIWKDDFVQWAQTLGWTLPGFLIIQLSDSGESLQNRHREETIKKMTMLVNMALQILQATPQRGKAYIAQTISRNLARNRAEDAVQASESNVRNLLFYTESSPFYGAGWDKQKAIARKNYSK